MSRRRTSPVGAGGTRYHPRWHHKIEEDHRWTKGRDTQLRERVEAVAHRQHVEARQSEQRHKQSQIAGSSSTTSTDRGPRTRPHEPPLPSDVVVQRCPPPVSKSTRCDPSHAFWKRQTREAVGLVPPCQAD